nr:MAG TPA: hypothetical protein [Caudoviricetes sp.]
MVILPRLIKNYQTDKSPGCANTSGLFIFCTLRMARENM